MPYLSRAQFQHAVPVGRFLTGPPCSLGLGDRTSQGIRKNAPHTRNLNLPRLHSANASHSTGPQSMVDATLAPNNAGDATYRLTHGCTPQP